MTRTTGCCSPIRPSRPRIPSSVRAWRRSGAVGPPPSTGAPTSASRGSRSGRRRMTSDVAGPSRAPRTSAGSVAQGRADRPDDGAVRLVGAGRPGGRAQDGHRLAQRAHPLDGLVEETGDPDARGPTEQQGPGHAVCGLVEPLGEAGECLLSSHEARARVPDRHTAFYGPGVTGPRPPPTCRVG